MYNNMNVMLNDNKMLHNKVLSHVSPEKILSDKGLYCHPSCVHDVPVDNINMLLIHLVGLIWIVVLHENTSYRKYKIDVCLISWPGPNFLSTLITFCSEVMICLSQKAFLGPWPAQSLESGLSIDILNRKSGLQSLNPPGSQKCLPG